MAVSGPETIEPLVEIAIADQLVRSLRWRGGWKVGLRLPQRLARNQWQRDVRLFEVRLPELRQRLLLGRWHPTTASVSEIPAGANSRT
jgi:hypothetical protein